VIPAFGHYLLTEAANYGGSSADAGRLISFSLRSGERRTLYLSSADNRGNLLGYRDSVELMALSPNQAQGRAAQSLGNDSFTRLEQPTPGSHNTTSAVGPLVIHEVMYNPSFVYPEFIELRNISSQRITLGDSAANHWRIRGGIDFDFPATSAIEANGFGLLVQGRAGQDEGSEASRFRQQFSIAANVPIFVYFAAAHGSLNNAGETVRLEQSWTLPGANTLRHSLVDEVRYENQAPWPLLADGRGASLSRFDATAVGMDAENWLASRDLGTPGAENLFYQYHVRGDFDGDRRRTARDIDLLSFQIRSQRIDPAFDLNGDQFLTEADRDELVSQILGTFAGDTNLDGRFDSRDIVLVMQAGHYDNLLVGPAGWSQGDWNGDGVFNSSDLVHAFQVGRYV
jgi:hypothetical protein